MPQFAISVPQRAVENAGGVISLDEVESPVVKVAISYWRNLRGSRPFPARSDMSPRDIRGLLRNIVLLRVVDGGADYDYRIIGDAHVIAYGFSMQGKLLSEMEHYAPGHGPVLKRLYDRVVRKREPYALRGWIERDGTAKRYIYSESAFMPMGDGDVVDHVFNASVYVPKDIIDG